MHRLQQNLEALRKAEKISDFSKNPSAQELIELAESLQISLDDLVYGQLPENAALRAKAAKVKLLVLDCDGVLTDGGMYLTAKGDEIKRFSARDGQGIKNAMAAGIEVGIISAGISTGLVEARAKMLGIKRVYVGSQAKMDILQHWMQELNLQAEQIAYVGDDEKDVEILRFAGFSAAPADAAPVALESALLRLSKNGGSGCVRELIDNYLL